MCRDTLSMPSDSTHWRNSSMTGKLPNSWRTLNAESVFPLGSVGLIASLVLMKNRLLLLVLILAASPLWSADFKRTEDVVYGRKFGTALTLDVIQPNKPNGAG